MRWEFERSFGGKLCQEYLYPKLLKSGNPSFKLESIILGYFLGHSVDTALLEWISEYAARAYTTPDSAVSYLNHARIA